MNKKILIVDDAVDVAEAFRKQLDLAGYEVAVANGGKQGLEKMTAEQFDLVILDLVMPDLDGIEVLKALRAQPEAYKKAPVIVSTNVTAADTRKEVEGLGAAGFVVKTDVDIEEVIGEFFAKS